VRLLSVAWPSEAVRLLSVAWPSEAVRLLLASVGTSPKEGYRISGRATPSWPPSALCRRGQDSIATDNSPESPFLFLPPKGRKKEKGKSEAERLVAASFASAGTSPTEGCRISVGDEPDERLSYRIVTIRSEFSSRITSDKASPARISPSD
jgi:hypothetical protein